MKSIKRFGFRILSFLLVGAIILPTFIITAAAQLSLGDYIYEKVKTCPTEIDLSEYSIANGWDKNTAKEKFIAAVKADERLFFVNLNIGSSYSSTSFVVKSITYTMTFAEADAIYQLYKEMSFAEYIEHFMNERATEINITPYALKKGWTTLEEAMAAYQQVLVDDTSLPYNSTKVGASGALGNKRNVILKNFDYAAEVKGSDLSFEDYMREQMEAYTKEIDILYYANQNGWTKDDAVTAVMDLIYDNPDLFFVKTEVYASTLSDSKTGKLQAFTIEVSYIGTKSGYSAAKKKYDAAVKTALATVNDKMTDVEKALVLHDYIAVNCAYDESVNDNIKDNTPAASYTSYGALVDGLAVCQGYSMAYDYLLEKCGIEATTIWSKSMNHAWTYVKLDGKWYHVDVTHDDPTGVNSLGTASHENFLLSDAAIKKTDHKGWDTRGLPKASSAKYNKYFWHNTDSNIAYLDGYYYYSVFNAKSPSIGAAYDGKLANVDIQTFIYKYSFATGKSTKVKTLTTFWLTWGINTAKTISYSMDTYTKLAAYNGAIYLNTYNKIYKLDSKGTLSSFMSPSTKTGYIYGLRIVGKKLQYSVKKAPDAVDTIKVKTL